MSLPALNQFVMQVNDKDLAGFESGEVRLTMLRTFNTFSFDYVADGRASGVRAVEAGDNIKLYVNTGRRAELVIDGFVDTTADEDSSDCIRISVSGRSRTADLYDCSAKPGSWKSSRASDIVKSIAGPFRIVTFVEGDDEEPFYRFSITAGETAMEAISRIAVRKGKQVWTVGGHLVIDTAGNVSTETVLERGVNIVRSTRTDTWVERHSSYTYLGQSPAVDDQGGRHNLKATARDRGVSRYRPFLDVRAVVSRDGLQAQADREAAYRAGVGDTINAVVDGWGNAHGLVWRPNMLVHFKNPVLRMDDQLIVAEVTFRFAHDQPRETELLLVRPETFL